MGSKIRLYHGSIHSFDAIDVTKGKPFKDFGAGFYLSPSKKHSSNLAIRNKHIEIMRYDRKKKKPKISAWLYTYELNSDQLSHLTIKDYPHANTEWMKFVVKNRNNSRPQHRFDIVRGPTANDNTRVSLQAFFAGAYGDINSDNAVETLIAMMEPQKLPIQYFFGSQRAANALIFLDKVIIE